MGSRTDVWSLCYFGTRTAPASAHLLARLATLGHFAQTPVLSREHVLGFLLGDVEGWRGKFNRRGPSWQLTTIEAVLGGPSDPVPRPMAETLWFILVPPWRHWAKPCVDVAFSHPSTCEMNHPPAIAATTTAW